MQKAFLSDEQWAKLEPLLPKTKSRGRPWADNRRVLEGILWVLKTGARWRDLPEEYPAAPAPAGGACANGKKMRCGSKSGGNSSVTWTSGASWIGANHFWTAVLLQQKKGRVRWQNQARQRHEVDGGGRRPRYSSGKPTGLGQSGGSDPGRKHAGADCRTARGPGPATTTTVAGDCRPGLRQRSSALATAPARHPAHLSASPGTAQTFAQRRAHFAPLPQSLEDRTHLCLAGQLPSTAGAL